MNRPIRPRHAARNPMSSHPQVDDRSSGSDTQFAAGHSPRHVAVLLEQSRAGSRALADAVAIADEHDAAITVVALVPQRCTTAGCILCRADNAFWNAELARIAKQELDAAHQIVGERAPGTHCTTVPGSDLGALPEVLVRLGCDLVVIPDGRWLRRRGIRRLQQAAPDLLVLRGR
jgi:nucleotide-binding universal stress UspA family protein